MFSDRQRREPADIDASRRDRDPDRVERTPYWRERQQQVAASTVVRIAGWWLMVTPLIALWWNANGAVAIATFATMMILGWGLYRGIG